MILVVGHLIMKLGDFSQTEESVSTSGAVFSRFFFSPLCEGWMNIPSCQENAESAKCELENDEDNTEWRIGL